MAAGGIVAHTNDQYSWYDPRRYDLGATEALQNLFKPTQAYASDGGGSNLFAGNQTDVGGNLQTALSPSTQSTSNLGGSPGTTTSFSGGGGGGGGASSGGANNTGGGGGTSGGNSRIAQLTQPGYTRNPAEDTELRNLEELLRSNLKPDSAAIDSVFSPVMNYLSGEESRISGQLPSVLQSAQEAFDVSKKTLGDSRSQGEQQLNEQGISAEQTSQSEENDARRLYDQLMRGGIQRFGGATSAGQGYQSLLGVEQQRGNSQLAQQYSTAKREIQTAAYTLRQDYENKMLGLEQQLRETQTTIKNQFDDRISQIRAMRAESEGAKANAQLAALQDMKNKMYQLDLSTLEYKRSLQTQASQAASQISQANDYWDNLVSSGQQSVNNFSDQNAGDAQTGLSLGNANNNQVATNLTGAINKKKDETTNTLNTYGGRSTMA